MEQPDIEPLAAALGIPLRAEWHETIRANLRISLAMGAMVAEMALDDDVEAMPVFSP